MSILRPTALHGRVIIIVSSEMRPDRGSRTGDERNTRARALAATISVHGDISTMDCVQSVGCPLIVLLLFERGRMLLLSPSFSLFGKRERMKVDFHRENAARETNSILNILVRRK